MIHAFYLTSHAAKNEISNSVFHSFSGSIIKITDASNQNSIIDNRFSWGPVGVLDYFCGCRPSHATLSCRNQCPSWDNYIPYESNAWSNLSWGKLAARYQPIPENECPAPPARSGIRMDLGTGGVLR